ncbi:MAG: RluA family pseudouridine synthase, partial [Chlamydiales bacterium]
RRCGEAHLLSSCQSSSPLSTRPCRANRHMNGDTFFVTEKESGLRLDKLLAAHFPQYSRTYFQQLISDNLVLVNGDVVKKRTLVTEGDEIEVEFALTPEISLEPENIPLDILYEDEEMIAVNKPAGMVVHPAVGNWTGTFVNALIFHCNNLSLEKERIRPGIVHRLDKETSGVLIAAKNERSHQMLVALFAERKVLKEYVAITIGNPGNRTITGNIGRHPTKRKQMAIVKEGGREAQTRVESREHGERLAVCHLFPTTGRTHQLRVHLKSVGCPILGDSLYGNPQLNEKYKVNRQLLHAYKLTLTHPVTQEKLVIEAPIPDDIQTHIKRMR